MAPRITTCVGNLDVLSAKCNLFFVNLNNIFVVVIGTFSNWCNGSPKQLAWDSISKMLLVSEWWHHIHAFYLSATWPSVNLNTWVLTKKYYGVFMMPKCVQREASICHLQHAMLCLSAWKAMVLLVLFIGNNCRSRFIVCHAWYLWSHCFNKTKYCNPGREEWQMRLVDAYHYSWCWIPTHICKGRRKEL